jgi:hypothetical protein
MSKLRNAARDQACIRCGAPHAVLCHYAGPWQHRFGKGRGLKGEDIGGAEFCSACHNWFDEYKGVDYHSDDAELQASQRSEEFLAMCILTAIRRAARGIE